VMNKCDIEAALPISKINEIINRKVFAEIPFDLSVVDESINAGIPIVKMFNQNKVSKAIEALANLTEGKNLVEKPESMLSQIFNLNKG
jgi:MinD-like ATPase involved in chromosome partitioning or flagellar assembly